MRLHDSGLKKKWLMGALKNNYFIVWLVINSEILNLTYTDQNLPFTTHMHSKAVFFYKFTENRIW